VAPTTAKRILTIKELSKTDAWDTARETGALEIDVEGKIVPIKMTSRPTPLGRYFYLVCPRCSSRRLHLYADGDRVGCRGCIKILHPTQALPSSKWHRQVVRVALQLDQLDRRLNKGGLERNLRRRLRRRRVRLARRLETALQERMEKLEATAAQ